MKQMRPYESPKFELIYFSTEDIMVVSNPDELPDDEW